MNKNFKLISELVFAANVKNIVGKLFIIDSKNLTNLSRKENIGNTLFIFLPYEKDTYMSLHILMQDDKWKFLELDTPKEITREELKELIKTNNSNINDIEYLPCNITYVLDHDYIPKEILIKLESPSKYVSKQDISLKKKQHYYGNFLSSASDWNFEKF